MHFCFLQQNTRKHEKQDGESGDIKCCERGLDLFLFFFKIENVTGKGKECKAQNCMSLIFSFFFFLKIYELVLIYCLVFIKGFVYRFACCVFKDRVIFLYRVESAYNESG